MTKDANVLLVGYGAVGKAFHELLHQEHVNLARAHGIRPKVVAICRSHGSWVDPTGLAPGATLLAHRRHLTPAEIMDEEHIDALVELTPTNLKTGEPGKTIIKQALERGIGVVTADKGPLVVDYRGLVNLAKSKGVPFKFEGSVAGAIPALNLHDHCLRGNPVTRVDGILNGTSNYILSRMAEEGRDFQQALEEAQEIGYAEADPTYDVDGMDAGAKLVILANHVLGLDLKLDQVHMEGIRNVTGGAMRLAESQGYTLKLVASVDAEKKRASVTPRLVPLASDLNVAGALNVVRLTTKHAGHFTLIGKGAGGKETATAVLSDLVAVLTASMR